MFKESVTPLLLSSISKLVSALGLCFKPGGINWKRVGSEPCLLILYLILFSICRTNYVEVYIVRHIWLLMWLGVYCMGISIQRLVEYEIVRFSDTTDYRLDEFILSILWERKGLPRWAIVLVETGYATHRPLLISPSSSLRKSHNLVCLTNSK